MPTSMRSLPSSRQNHCETSTKTRSFFFSNAHSRYSSIEIRWSLRKRSRSLPKNDSHSRSSFDRFPNFPFEETYTSSFPLSLETSPLAISFKTHSSYIRYPETCYSISETFNRRNLDPYRNFSKISRSNRNSSRILDQTTSFFPTTAFDGSSRSSSNSFSLRSNEISNSFTNVNFGSNHSLYSRCDDEETDKYG